jgi:hypothetical protein
MSQESDMLARALQRVAAQANGEEPATATTPRPATKPAKRRTVAQIMRPRSEEQGQCPQCGYTAPLDDFDNGDSESDGDGAGFETDESTSKTDGDDQENALAKRLLKAASYKPEQAAGEKPKQLTREQASELIAKALKAIRR